MQPLPEHDPALSASSAMNTHSGFSPRAPRRSRIKRLVIWLLLLALLGGGIYGWKTRHTDDAKTKAAQAAAATTTVTRGDIEDVVTSQGKLEPKEYVDVGAQVSGQLKKIFVELGDTVKQGDLIAEIDPEILQAKVNGDEARLKTLQAQLAEQQATITFAQQQYERNERLIKQDAISKEALQNSAATYKAAQARAASLKAQIEEAASILNGDRVNLGYTKIYAPMDGTVVVQTSREGQTLNAIQTAPVIVQLANLDTMTVRAQVAEADVTSIKPNMDVYFTTLGNLTRRWHGKVRQILPTPEIINAVVLYNVLVDVDNSDRQLMSGMTTQMFFVRAQAKNVLTVPATAVGKPVPDKDSDAGKAHIVKIPNGKTPLEQIVHIGLMNRSVAEIRDGLQDGQTILLNATASTTDTKPNGPRMGPRI